MSELLGVTVEDLVDTMKSRRVRIPSEIGAFIALEICDALRTGPAQVRGADVRIGEDGSISVFAPPGSATSEQAARSIVGVLGSLLVAAGTGVPRGLVTLLEKGPRSGRLDLPSLRDDLEASLVPLNRGAARRVLSRMLREARKPRSESPNERPHSAPAPRDGTLDAQLDDLLGAPPPMSDAIDLADHLEPDSQDDFGLDSLDRELDATLSEFDPASVPPPEPDVPASDATLAEHNPPSHMQEEDAADLGDEPLVPRTRPLDPDPDPPSRAYDDDIDAFASGLEGKKKSNPMPWVLAFVAVLAATAAAFALMRPDLVDQMLGRPPPPPPDEGPTEEDRERMLAEHRARFGVLTVRAVPDDAQIFMFVGRGPADALEMPVGIALEFIAIADGRAPSRTVLPSDAEWQETDDGPRFDLAMQVGTEEMADEELVLGETQLPRDVGAGTEAFGTVHVITNPPDAKVYVLVGFSPSAIVENVRTDEAVELLIYHDGHPVARQTIGASDWIMGPDGTKVAEVSVILEGAEVPEEE